MLGMGLSPGKRLDSIQSMKRQVCVSGNQYLTLEDSIWPFNPELLSLGIALKQSKAVCQSMRKDNTLMYDYLSTRDSQQTDQALSFIFKKSTPHMNTVSSRVK